MTETTIRRKLSKLLATAKDERCVQEVRLSAMALFERLCAKHAINPKSVRTDGVDGSIFNIARWDTGDRRVSAFVKVCGAVVSQFWNVRIQTACFAKGNVLLDFITPKPNLPEEAMRCFQILMKHSADEWERFKARTRVSDTVYLFACSTFSNKPNRQSFVSGFYHTMREALQREKDKRISLRKFIETAHDKGEKAALLMDAPEPWERPPANPLALMCLPKKVKKEKPKRNPPPWKRQEPIPEPEPVQTEPPDETFDHSSYLAGIKAALNIDTNQFKL